MKAGFIEVLAGAALLLAACGGSAAPSAAPASSAAAPVSSAAAAAKPSSAAPAASSAAAKPAASAPGKPAASAASASAAAGASGAAPAPVALAKATGQGQKVRIGVNGLAAESGLYTALEHGYFKEAGVDPEITKFVSGAEVVLQLAGGQLDIGSGGPDPSFFNAVARGVPLKLIASEAMVTKNDASAALVVRQDLIDSGKYKTPADLKGMTIAVVSLGTSSQMYVERILTQAGLTINDVKLTTVPFPNMVTALSNKAVDAAWSVEPFVTVEKSRKIASIGVPLSEAYPGAITQMFTIGPGFAKDHPDTARAFATAYLKGERDYYRAFVANQDPAARTAIIQFLPKYTGGTADQLASIGMTGADPNAQIDPRYIDTVQSYFASKDTVKQKVDVKQAIDNSYIDAAVQQLGKVAVAA